MIGADELAAALNNLALDEVVEADHAAADALASFEHGHVAAGMGQFVGRRQPGEAGAEDEDALTGGPLGRGQGLAFAEKEAGRSSQGGSQDFAAGQAIGAATKATAEVGIEKERVTVLTSSR